jgi:beta-galactosidase
MEMYDQGHGCLLYRTTLPAGPATALQVDQASDFGWVWLNGKKIGILDRRSRRFEVKLPARTAPEQLDILIEAMGHVNFGREIHDRKGLVGAVRLVGQPSLPLNNWQVFPFPLDDPELAALKWKPGKTPGPAFWRGGFQVERVADTFLDLRGWGKGVVWVNGHCLSRFWDIGPTQTAYVPGPWLRRGRNEVIVLDLLGPKEPVLAGLERPILDQLRPELDFSRSASTQGHLNLAGVQPACTGSFKPGPEVQEVRLAAPVEGSQFCLEALSSLDGKPFAAIAELDLLDENGQSIPHTAWTIPYADSEELVGEDGSASNAIDGQSASFWHTQWKDAQPAYPHRLVIDLGASVRIGGFRYTPRAGEVVAGRIKDYQVYIGANLAHPADQ